jgi:hypothetical protein
MQLPDNNMDELFRRAGENYPLKTHDDDWEAIAGKLADQTVFEPTETVGKKGYRKILWLLALLPLAAIGYNYFYKNGSSEKNIAQQKNLSTPEKSLQKRNHVNITAPSNALIQIISANKGIDNANTVNRESSIVKKYQQPSYHSYLQNDLSNDKNAESKNINDQNKFSAHVNFMLKNNSSNHKDDLNVDSKAASLLNNQLLQSGNKIANDKTMAISDNNNSQNATDDKNLSIAKHNEVVNENNSAAKKSDSSLNKNIHKKTVLAKARQHFLYAGLLAGPDASTVKMQSINGVGYSLGLLAGYHVSQHWSIEAGILWDKKNYYTNGEYFNTSKINILPGEQLKDMNGTCGMFEIPVNVKYDFAKTKRGNFFAAAGISSYIMKNESYDYSAVYNGWNYNGTQSYNNSSQNWFSVAQLSIGYEKQLGKKFNLRIEPYLKIPLHGVGIGSLPITSGGLYIGITKRIP